MGRDITCQLSKVPVLKIMKFRFFQDLNEKYRYVWCFLVFNNLYNRCFISRTILNLLFKSPIEKTQLEVPVFIFTTTMNLISRTHLVKFLELSLSIFLPPFLFRQRVSFVQEFDVNQGSFFFFIHYKPILSDMIITRSFLSEMFLTFKNYKTHLVNLLIFLNWREVRLM